MTAVEFSPADLARLAERGIPEAEARRQVDLLRHPPRPVSLARPCTVGDGVRALTPEEQAVAFARGEAVVASGRVSKFVPASGAATRMFQALISATDSSEPPSSSAAVGEFFFRFDHFPFARRARDLARLEGPLDTEHAQRAMLRAVLEGLGYATLPKGLVTFHHGAPPHTAFEDQLREGVHYTRASTGLSRMHFTVVNDARTRFADTLESLRAALEKEYQCALRIEFSEQEPSSDTLAIDDQGQPFRLKSGELLFRPAGHGALIGNLQAHAGDVVVIKNIDNILPVRSQEVAVRWKLILIGLLAELEEVRGTGERPLRVCGVVRNAGEPGGAPFWVRSSNGSVTAQIVESAQIDAADSEQRRIFESATHFNPVDVVCSLRDRNGRPFDLARFVDADTAFISRKSHEGRALTALERPGLWNGAMAGWDTVCVEVPAETFVPVKTVLDLLRPQHQ